MRLLVPWIRDFSFDGKNYPDDAQNKIIYIFIRQCSRLSISYNKNIVQNEKRSFDSSSALIARHRNHVKNMAM